MSYFSEQVGSNLLEDETEEDFKVNVGDPPSEDDELVKVTSSTEIRELYAITPSANFADSSDDDDDGSTEMSPLVKNEPTSFESTSSTELPETTSLNSTSLETRPLLSRQLEIDQCSQSSKDTSVNSFDQEERMKKNSEECRRAKVPTTLSILGNHDELESQRVTPILFTLSPTKKGTNQVVSVVATRDLPTAFSRPQSMPNSPCTHKPKSPRSPKSPMSFRGIFGCRSSSDKDIDRNLCNLNPKTSNGSISAPNTAVEECVDNTVSENPSNENSNKSKVFAQNEDVITNGDMQVTCEEISANEHHAKPDDVCKGYSKDGFCFTEHQSEACNANKPDNLIPTDEMNITVSSSAEDAVIVLHSEPLPPRVPVLSHRSSQQDLSKKGTNTNDSFEESTNNSDKGYESVDNSPCVENDESICRLLKTNGAVPSRGISKVAQNGISEKIPPYGLDDLNVISSEPREQTRSVWMPLMDSRPPVGRKTVTAITASQPDCNVFSQTAV